MEQNSKLEVVRYSNEYEQQWDDFISHSNNGTLFHRRAFLSYHPPDRFQDDSLLFFKDGNLLAVFPAATRPSRNRSIICSHPGASFGGFVTNYDLSLRDTERLIARFLAYCRERDYAGVELTLPPQIYLARPNHYIDFILYQRGFRYGKREVSSVIPLDLPDERLVDLFPRESRRAIRRAQKRGVKVEESRDLSTFYALLEQHMKQRHDVKPTHTLEELNELRVLFPQSIRLFAAFVEKEMIAGMIIFVCNAQAALAFYYVSQRQSFQRYHGFNLLFYEVLRWCTKQGFRFLDFGTFTINMKSNLGLADFKESFGARGVFRDTLSLKL